ncbi:T9SS type A sorting domain-containing protein [Hymenobacter canadensis]|uniref:T9SS type A sorting domain-containing protein n=1 Tax=Hymenobacter canadensis TaxID=2999067 RepID=A0ABY7LM38_9BACT|nr:T9SS type A sorting domain-containing protein [Hymenobacter canadensis]WBA41488.1 T9SS type A sorting domain-containing protein [Hymenobacter canadensis]
MLTSLLSAAASGNHPAPGLQPGRWQRRLPMLVLLGLLGASAAQAQVVRTLPGDYTTLAAAITDLNTNGVPTGGVTINIAAGYTETAANLTLTASGTAANPVVFQKAGTGANPLLTAGTGTSTTTDGLIRLSGADYVTFDGLDVAESAANTTTTTQMEFGYGLFRASATDGCQNNIIRNCVVTLNKTNAATIGIAGLASGTGSATAVPATNPAGANSNNLVYGNVVSNALKGIDFAAGSATTPLANFDQNNQVGLTPAGAAAGNTVGNFGGTASGWGIGGNYQNGYKVANNVVNSTLNYTSATASAPVAASTVTSTLRGIYGNAGAAASLDFLNNTVTLASGATTSQLSGIENGIGATGTTNTVNITGNTVTGCTYATATTGIFYGLYNSATAGTVNISGNTVSNNTVPGSGAHYLISGSSPTTLNILNNQLSGNTKGGSTASTSGTMFCISAGTAAVTASGNTISNNRIVSSGTSSSTLNGYYNFSSPPSETVTNNTITNLTVEGSTSSSTSAINGILTNPASTTTKLVSQNVIGNLSLTVGGTVYGIQSIAGNAVSISRNKIYGLSAAATAGTVYGLFLSTGTAITASNNLIGDLTAPTSSGVNAVCGVFINSGTNVNLYYNTLYLAAVSSSATFGTSGIYAASLVPVVDLRNNLVVNNSTSGSTGGATVALRYLAAPGSSLAGTTNNNIYYAGTPGAANLIYAEGTTTLANAQQTLAAYRTYVAAREQNSLTENPTFVSTTGTAAGFLHLSPSVPTQAESAAAAISGLTLDYDGETRGTLPDIGADEGTFAPLDMSVPIITLTPLSNTTSTANRTLSVTIVDASGIATGANAPRLFFRKGSSGTYQSVAASSVSGDVYTFTFDYALVGGVTGFDAIQYYVVAQDASPNANVSSSPAGGTFTTPPASVYQFLIQGQLSGTYYVGTGTSPDPTRTYATLTAATQAYSNNLLAGPVTFLLLDASYGPAETFPILLANNATASATNTLTIKPTTGLTTTLTGSNATALIALIGADYVTLDGNSGGTISGTDPRPSRNWTLSNTSTATSSNGIVLTVPNSGTDNASNNTFRNLAVSGSGGATAQAGILMLSATTNTVGNANNVVQNNAVSGATFGIYSVGPSATVKNTGTIITQNDMTVTGTGAIGRYGITGLFEDGIQVTQNTVDGINSAATADVWGINLGFTGLTNNVYTGNEVTNATIDRNYVGSVRQTNTYSAAGIALAAATSGTSVISNNMVAGVSSNGTAGDFGAGIFLGGGTGSITRVAFNSVSMSGTQTGGAQPGFALAVGGATPTVDIRNNVLANTQTTGTGKNVALGLAYSSSTGAYAGLTSSNNDFFVGSGAAFLVGQTGGLVTAGIARTTLADLNTETGQDNPATSKTADPQFASATDLHSTSPALNNAGVPVAGITVDFDGQSRSANTPDIGADEFALLDLATAALTGPTAGAGCYSAAEAVSVTIRNNAATALDFATTPATITATVTGGTTPQTLTATVNTGTLAPGASLAVPVGTADLSAAGTYSLTATVAVAGDENTANNTLATPLSIVSTPRTVAFTYPAGTICASSTAPVAATLGGGAATGGTFSAPTGLILDATTGAITPATSTPGTYTVTYTVTASGACPAVSATQSVTITPAASAAFSYSTATFCQSGTNPVATVTGTSGGTFSAPTGLSLDATTGTISLTASTPGTYTVTYTAGTACPASATFSVTITAPATAGFSYAATSFCASQATAAAATLATGATAGTFSSTTGLTINATTGAITPSTSTPGTYTVTNTVAASGGCAAATSTFSVTITAAPVATFSYANAAYCVGATGTAAPTLASGATAGTFSAPAGLSLNATTGVITLGTSAAGTYIVTNTVAASGACAATTATFSVTINARPAQPTVAPVYNGATTTLTSSSATGNQWYLNGTLIAGATNPTYVVNTTAQFGQYTVVVTNAATGCASLPSAPLLVNSSVKPLAGSALSVYPNPTPDGNVSVELRGYTKATELRVYNAVGQQVLERTLSGQPGVQTATLDLRQLPAGVYILRARTEGGLDMRRITKQ